MQVGLTAIGTTSTQVAAYGNSWRRTQGWGQSPKPMTDAERRASNAARAEFEGRYEWRVEKA